MAIPTVKSNAGDKIVYKKKNLSLLFSADRKIHPSDHCLASLGTASWCQPSDAKQWPSGGFFYPHLTPMKDSYNPTHVKFQTLTVFW